MVAEIHLEMDAAEMSPPPLIGMKSLLRWPRKGLTLLR